MLNLTDTLFSAMNFLRRKSHINVNDAFACKVAVSIADKLERHLNSVQRLHETIADIAHLAGSVGYYSGDSRADMQSFIHWAEQFQALHAGTDWETADIDYIEAVEKFAMDKLNKSGHALYNTKIELYKNLIDDNPIFTDVTVRSVKHENGECSECDLMEANMFSVYLTLPDGRKMCAIDADNHPAALLLQSLLKLAMKQTLQEPPPYKQINLF